MNNNVKILDCTLRDGGYYTNWDFDRGLVDTYLKSMELLPIEYLEVGYRNPPLDNYQGEYYYCPEETLKYLKSISSKKLAIILNEKDVNPSMLDELLSPCLGIVHLVRIAIDPANFKRAITLAKGIKQRGFLVGFNVMYMSKWNEYPEMLDLLGQIDGLVEYFYLVDSFGGVFPDDVRNTIGLIREKSACKIGFHGHNNLEMALANTLVAIDAGADVVDATMTGMGRGAGNLKTELLLTTLNKTNDVKIDFNALSEVTAQFQKLQEEYMWGTSLPYMVSGVNSLPQKKVMDWVSKRYFSINSIVRALNNDRDQVKDNLKLDLYKSNLSDAGAIMIGGGESVQRHSVAIRQFLMNRPEIVIIHASSRHARMFGDLPNKQIFCLVGNEGVRLERVFEGLESFSHTCVLPPYPRKMGTFIPKALQKKATELKEVTFTSLSLHTHLVTALQVSIELNTSEIFSVGFDGYSNSELGSIERELFAENEKLFTDYHKFLGKRIISLTPTEYESLIQSTIYKF